MVFFRNLNSATIDHLNFYILILLKTSLFKNNYAYKFFFNHNLKRQEEEKKLHQKKSDKTLKYFGVRSESTIFTKPVD